ncbi:MAG: polysaccharide biosynthesis tyrosine autokinase [Thermomicrobiales bacterium]
MELELRQLFGYARRWWWLLILLPAIAAATAYVSSSRQPDMYRATATLLIEPSGSQGVDLYTMVYAGQSLAATYQELVDTDPILAPVEDRFGPLDGQVSASAIAGTQLLRVSASDTDPARAAEIANAVANQFVSFISQQEASDTSTSQSALQERLDVAQRELESTRQQVLDIEASGATDAAAQADLDRLRNRQDQQDASVNDLLLRMRELELNAALAQNEVRLSVPAAPPADPYAPRTMFFAVFAALLGALIAVGAVGLLEYLDNTVKPSLAFESAFGAPLLSVLGVAPKVAGGHDQLFVVERPNSNMAEEIRLLRANVEFAAATNEISSLAITSAGPGEGKSTITANLAVAMTQTGFSVAIVDADLRRPSQHRIFGVGNDRGLTTLLTRPNRTWEWAALDVLPNLKLIPSGPVPPNPADLLSLERLHELMAELTHAFDVVLVDTPPVLAVSDPLVVAPHVDAVCLIAQSGRTRVDALRRASASLRQASARIVGIVLNQQTGRDASGYYYYDDYYNTNPPRHAPGDGDPTPDPAPTRVPAAAAKS